MNSACPVPAATKVLVLAPHPDDEALGCGGTLALYSAAGIPVQVAFVSDGGKVDPERLNDPEIIKIRQDEARKAASILGIKAVHFFGFPDGELEGLCESISEKISALVSEVSPDIVFAPSPIDFHRDHIAVSEAALKILNDKGGFKLAFYEVYETVRFNHLVDISGLLEIKQKAIMQYETSLMGRPSLYADSTSGMNRFKAIYTGKPAHYEAFWIVEAPFSRDAMLDWLLYGMKHRNQADEFLEKLRAIDILADEHKKCAEQLALRERELASSIPGHDKSLLEAERLRTELDLIQSTLAWKAVQRFYRIRDGVMPAGSGIRRLYDKAVNKLARRSAGS